ncbi:McrC family protein [Phyllobacterium sp. A18/5-2]|uniref:McrC family protein n=1 Tax=Phyllobacterium sp. A18/5-2 TaxID=2978392 RepID=UPI0021CA7309|nr:McrC family protein [Phyllobacterium sp. A18/5-2]UXN65409.1 McrC family protein [Phyllobacterium sp. A18/5-2]
MTFEVIECEEFQELSLRLGSLMENGELKIDERIASKGYLTTSMAGGQIAFRTTRFVGTIPVTPTLAIKVTPRASIANLSYMLVRSGVIPAAISGFSRGYMPRFVSASNVEKIYGRSLVDGTKLIAKRGFVKSYVKNANAPPWRGRFMASETVKRHASKGIRYRHEFDHSTLSATVIANISLKEALKQVRQWYLANERKNPIVKEIDTLLHNLWSVTDWDGRKADLVSELSRKVRSIPPQLAHYRDPLWAAFLILQSLLPDVSFDGYVKLDSLIIDVSAVFEAFIRRELAERLWKQGYSVEDGNKRPGNFFVDGGGFTIHPDIVIKKDGIVVALLDAKYKTDPKEQDRYEVLSFMDAMNVDVGGFVCPTNGVDTSRYLGSTATGKKMFGLRYDLAAEDLDVEAERFSQNAIKMITGSHDFT